MEITLTPEHKLKILIEDELTTLSIFNPDLAIRNPSDCDIIARYLADSIMDERPKYRSGRRISDRLKDKLLDIQQWWKTR